MGRKTGFNSSRTKEVLKTLLIRDGALCWICGNAMDMSLPRDHDEAPTIEHKVPLHKERSNKLENLALSHSCCNYSRGRLDERKLL